MKVLFVNTNDTSGGAARAARRIMSAVQGLGVEATMLVKDKASDAPDVIALSDFVPKSRLYAIADWIAKKIKNKWQHLQWRPYRNTKQQLYLSDMRSTSLHGALQKMDYDILHLHWVNNRFLDLRELRKVGKPIVWTLHDSWPFTGVCHVPYDCHRYESHCGQCPMLGSAEEEDLAYRVFEEKLKALEGLDLHIVTPSNWLAECVKKSAILKQYPITVIPNAIDTDLYKPMDKNEARQQLGLDPDKKYILFGAMQATQDPNKGFTYLRDALNQLDYEAELIIYGTDENMDKYSIALPVHAFGYITSDETMCALYNAADVTVVPSLSENLSNTIMESLVCGVPVVAFNIGGNSDMIEHMRNGYLVAEKDSEDMSNGIFMCLQNNLSTSLNNEMRKKAHEQYSLLCIAKQYKCLYDSL